MSGFTKLFSSITDSTIWQEPDPTRIVWITMLAMADQRGRVDASVPGLASRARVTLEACVKALDTLRSPDQWSRTKDYDGRRIEDVDGGWLLLNHAKYRAERSQADRLEYQRNLMAERRRKAKEAALAGVSKVSRGEPGLAQAEAEAEADTERSKAIGCLLNGGSVRLNATQHAQHQEDQQLSDSLPLILTDSPDGEQGGSGTKPKGRRRRQGEPTGDALCDIVIGAYESILCAPERKGKCLKVSALTPKRKRRIVEADKMARGFCEREGLSYSASDFWPRYFQECMLDPWMRGDVPNPNNADWKPHLGLLIDETRFTKIMDQVVTRQ